MMMIIKSLNSQFTAHHWENYCLFYEQEPIFKAFNHIMWTFSNREAAQLSWRWLSLSHLRFKIPFANGSLLCLQPRPGCKFLKTWRLCRLGASARCFKLNITNVWLFLICLAALSATWRGDSFALLFIWTFAKVFRNKTHSWSACKKVLLKDSFIHPQLHIIMGWVVQNYMFALQYGVTPSQIMLLKTRYCTDQTSYCPWLPYIVHVFTLFCPFGLDLHLNNCYVKHST